MKILIGTPIRRFDNIEPLRDLLRWAWPLAEKHEVRFFLDCTYGVDVARSRILGEAKAWGAELVLMVDSDCVIRLAAREVLSVINQAWSRGFGLLISPTVSVGGKVLVWAPTYMQPYARVEDIPVGKAFEIAWGALGFAALKGDALSRLKVLKEQEFVNQDGVKEPLYCIYTTGGDGEDKSLCENFAASTGLKVGADTRLFVDHIKPTGFPSWRGPFFAV